MTVLSNALPNLDGSRRLEALGTSEAILREAVRIGYGHAAGCTDHEPRPLPGILVWGKGIGHLRDEHKPDAWTALSEQNFEMAVHPSGSHGIALVSGNGQTGRRSAPPPRTKTSRGPVSVRAIAANKQLSFAGRHPAFGEEKPDSPARETWFLLHHYDAVVGEIRLELSRPNGMTGGQVTSWAERLILEPIQFSTQVEIDDEDDDDGEIDVDVTRRAI